jgi:hypothetical protein
MLLRIFLAPTSFLAAIIWTIWAQAAEPIMVLAPFNLTGPQAVLGAPCYKGAELAVEKLNAAGGVLGRPIELIPIDTASQVSRPTNELEGALEHCRHRSHGFHLCSRGYFKRPESASSRRALQRRTCHIRSGGCGHQDRRWCENTCLDVDAAVTMNDRRTIAAD